MREGTPHLVRQTLVGLRVADKVEHCGRQRQGGGVGARHDQQVRLAEELSLLEARTTGLGIAGAEDEVEKVLAQSTVFLGIDSCVRLFFGQTLLKACLGEGVELLDFGGQSSI